jgi:hypothetical protein
MPKCFQVFMNMHATCYISHADVLCDIYLVVGELVLAVPLFALNVRRIDLISQAAACSSSALRKTFSR